MFHLAYIRAPIYTTQGISKQVWQHKLKMWDLLIKIHSYVFRGGYQGNSAQFTIDAISKRHNSKIIFRMCTFMFYLWFLLKIGRYEAVLVNKCSDVKMVVLPEKSYNVRSIESRNSLPWLILQFESIFSQTIRLHIRANDGARNYP